MTEEPDKDIEPTPDSAETAAEDTAVAAESAAASPEAADEPAAEPDAEAEAPAPKPRRRRRKAAAPAVEAGAEADATEAETPEPEAEPVAEEPEAEMPEPVVEEPEAEMPEPVADEPEAETPEPVADEPEAETPARPSVPAPTRRRRERDPDLPAPIVRAQAKYVRSSARKARLVCDNIRGKSVDEARAILALTPRAIARDWSKLLESAVANAEHNHELVGEDLYVKAVHADEGPTIKRFRPRAMGRATRIRKRTSHLTIMLTPKD